MNYVKKMCILRQVKQGFSGDGKALSGLIKIEQYGKNLSVEVSIINFAPLVSGEYYCLLSDRNGQTEMLSLRGKSLFNILSDLDISQGFCGVICYVKNEVVPIAYGVNGNGSYDWKSILNATLPPLYHKKSGEKVPVAAAEDFEEEPLDPETEESGDGESEQIPEGKNYDDESVATENYYEEKEHERDLLSKNSENAHAQSAMEEQREKAGADTSENVDAQDVLHPFKVDGDGYYLAVKAEIDELLRNYPHDNTLRGAFSCSEWVRVKGDAKDPQYLVGVVYDDGKAKYICYALAAEDRHEPPKEIAGVCTFVPASPFDTEKGFFVIFQSASTGECIKPRGI